MSRQRGRNSPSRRGNRNDKRDARELQRYTGATYSTCLRWVRTLYAEGLIDRASKAVSRADRATAVRVALHLRFADVRVARDEP